MGSATIDSYNRTAKEYAEKTKGFVLKNEIDEFVSCLPNKQYVSILDLGCGPGRDAREFSKRGYEVIGLDASVAMIEIALQAAPDAYFQARDIKDMNFPKGRFDGIWANSSLIHISRRDLPKVISNCYNILEDKGVFFLSMKKGKGTKEVKDERYRGVKKKVVYHDKDSLEKLLIKKGFTVFDTHDTGIENPYTTNPWINFFCYK